MASQLKNWCCDFDDLLEVIEQGHGGKRDGSALLVYQKSDMHRSTEQFGSDSPMHALMLPM